MNYFTNEQIIDSFEEVRFETGLVQADFTISLIHDGVLSLLPVSISEIGAGLYSISFTPDQEGTWSVSLRVTNYSSARYQKSYSVKNNIQQQVWDVDVASLINPGNFADYINRVKKYTSNRLVITNNIYSVKEDDGVSEFESGTLSTTERAPD
jgi:hypothetical protein